MLPVAPLLLAAAAFQPALALRPLAVSNAAATSFGINARRLSVARPPVLCAAAPAPAESAPLPPRLGLLELARGNTWRVIAATLLILLDITFYTFPLPFLGDYLLSTGTTPAQVANLIAAFTYTGLVAGLLVLVRELKRAQPRTQRQRYVSLAIVAFVMAAVSAAQSIAPTYPVLFGCRLVQGGATQLAWSSALATAASLNPVAGIKATAWVMAGNSLGEVLGPQFGATLFTRGGVRLPFAVASALAASLAAALGLAAASLGKEDGGTSRRLRPADAARTRDESGGGSSGGSSGGGLRKSVLRDGPSLWLCGLIALTCGTVRSLLDALLPLFLRSVFGFSVTAISNAMLAAALFFVVGSTGGGFLLAQRPGATYPALGVCGVLSALVTAALLLPTTGFGVSALFCAYFLISAVTGVAVTSALEERGRLLGAVDDVMALQVFFWTLGFTAGGLLSVFATAGAATAARQQLTLAVLGLINLLYTFAFFGFARPKTNVA
jgi:predicted MFS family arabinose efflux permease